MGAQPGLQMGPSPGPRLPRPRRDITTGHRSRSRWTGGCGRSTGPPRPGSTAAGTRRVRSGPRRAPSAGAVGARPYPSRVAPRARGRSGRSWGGGARAHLRGEGWGGGAPRGRASGRSSGRASGSRGLGRTGPGRFLDCSRVAPGARVPCLGRRGVGGPVAAATGWTLGSRVSTVPRAPAAAAAVTRWPS